MKPTERRSQSGEPHPRRPQPTTTHHSLPQRPQPTTTHHAQHPQRPQSTTPATPHASGSAPSPASFLSGVSSFPFPFSSLSFPFLPFPSFPFLFLPAWLAACADTAAEPREEVVQIRARRTCKRADTAIACQSTHARRFQGDHFGTTGSPHCQRLPVCCKARCKGRCKGRCNGRCKGRCKGRCNGRCKGQCKGLCIVGGTILGSPSRTGGSLGPDPGISADKARPCP